MRLRRAEAMAPRSLQILWPAFLVAGVLEMLVFAVVDPGELHGFGGAALDWPRQAVYTVTFLVLWGAVAAAAAITALLMHGTRNLNRDPPPQ
jgi:hypothetical protein